MAHADYSCCLICDCKMMYEGFSEHTKESCCNDCLSKMREMGEIFLTPQELKSKLGTLSFSKSLSLLHKLGYSPCYYGNEIDQYLTERGLITTKAKDGKWGKRLRKLPNEKGKDSL